MVEKYVKELKEILKTHKGAEVKHFFTGAAAYYKKKIFASLTPKGFALKLPENEVENLFKKKQGKPLSYFKKCHIKKNYAIITIKNQKTREVLIKKSIDYVS